MNIENFSDLSDFIYSEYDKMTESLGLASVSDKSIHFIEKSVRKYSKIYDKPLFLKEKREIELMIAFDTMPHGWLWKAFHPKLWAKMKKIIEEGKKEEKKTSEEKLAEVSHVDISVPAVILPNETDVVVYDDSSDFDTDFD